MNPTEHVLTIFENFSAIPRGSGREQAVTRWLVALASERGYASRVDESGNLLIRIPATPGRENAPIIILQGHMDMVCEKTPDSPHDFLNDPIRCIVDGEVWQDGARFRRTHQRPIGYVFQEGRLFPHLTVRENVLVPLVLVLKEPDLGTAAKVRVEAAMKGHVIAQAELIGTYQKKQ